LNAGSPRVFGLMCFPHGDPLFVCQTRSLDTLLIGLTSILENSPITTGSRWLGWFIQNSFFERNHIIFHEKAPKGNLVLSKANGLLKEFLSEKFETLGKNNLNPQELAWGSKLGLRFSNDER